MSGGWYNISDEKTFEKEVLALLQIKDAYLEMVIARTRHDEYQYEGIKVVDIVDCLLGDIQFGMIHKNHSR